MQFANQFSFGFTLVYSESFFQCIKQVHNSSPVSEVCSDTHPFVRRRARRLEVDVEAAEIHESDMEFKSHIS